MTPESGRSAAAHLPWVDADEALLNAEGNKHESRDIVTTLLLAGWIATSDLALRALAVLHKHEEWIGGDLLARLLDLACVKREWNVERSAWQEPAAAALARAAAQNIDLERFHRWCEPLPFSPFSFRRLAEALPPDYAADLALVRLRGRKWPEGEPCRVLGRSGRLDLIDTFMREGPHQDHADALVVAHALDAATAPAPALGELAVAAGLKHIVVEARGWRRDFALLDGIDNSDFDAALVAFARRLAVVAPQALGAACPRFPVVEEVQALAPVLRTVPGAALEWLDSLREIGWFDLLVEAALPGTEPASDAAPGTLPDGYLQNTAGDESWFGGPDLLRDAPELKRLVEDYRARPAARVLQALEMRSDHDRGMTLARRVVDHVFAPADLAGLFASCTLSSRLMRPELVARLPADAFVPLAAALRPDPIGGSPCLENWIARLPDPLVAWRAVARHAPTPELRGRGRARLAARDVDPGEPVEEPDPTWTFGHQLHSEPVTPALCNEARRVLSDAFVAAPGHVECWSDLAWVVSRSGDADLIDRLRRVWRTVVGKQERGGTELTCTFASELDATSDRDFAVRALAGLNMHDPGSAEWFLEKCTPICVLLAARSPKIAPVLRAAAVARVIARGEVDPSQLELTDPEVLALLLDPNRLLDQRKVYDLALERSWHVVLERPLDPGAEDAQSVALRRIREETRRVRTHGDWLRELVRQRLRRLFQKVSYAAGRLTTPPETVGCWLRAAATVRDWPDGRLATEIAQLAARLDPAEKATLSDSFERVRTELSKAPLEDEAERSLLLKVLTLHPVGSAS